MQEIDFGDLRIPQRMWNKVSIADDGCWNWTGANSGKGVSGGYGATWLNGRLFKAHRAFYILAYGEPPAGLVFDHICRNHACVNLKHLRLVTNKENVLSGTSMVAENKKKTICLRGHSLVGENAHPYRGHRYCKTCRRERQRMVALRAHTERLSK